MAINMRLFDLHCDTIGECWKQKKDLFENDLHLSLQRGGVYTPWRQVFAVFIPDSYRGKAAWDYFLAIYDDFLRQVEQRKDMVLFCRTSDDLTRAEQEGKCAAMLSVEGGAVLGGALPRIQELYRLGVRLITLTWNGENELGCGCGKQFAGGLTPLGREAVREMERVGMAVDVSHLSRRGFWDVAGIAEASFLASHSNCNAVYRHPRNLTDRQIACIISRGGLIGINLYRAFLGRPGHAGFAAAHRHIQHVMERGGADVLALGSDFDGCELEPCFAGIEKLEAFQDYLLSNGMTREQADAVFYKNAEKFFQNLLQPETDMLK